MKERDNYNNIYNNGINHIETAKWLADNKKFGFAISHIILGMEELIKYLVILSHSNDSSLFTAKEIDSSNNTSIFRSHKTKHNLIEEFQKSLSSDFSNTFLEYVYKIATGKEVAEKYSEIINNRFKEIGNFLSSCFKEINLTEDERKDFFQWVNIVKNKNLKNRGFYVNLENNTWGCPSDLTEEDYKKSLKYSTVFLQLTEIVKSLDITEEEFIQLLNSEIK